ncbi:MAG TPA: Glu-tRNA(Gln) amidotransferase subunit GatE [Thermoprotei archaeon]|nr:Glu-tRNA(Gln) amidotransferase subunit GatE [Thermoprotei archaeon]
MKDVYRKYKLKVGLEIHFQLNTMRKLFCHCPVGLTHETRGFKFERRLRPTQSELGQVDPAAYFEFQKGVKIIYYAPEDYTCLVETDEEPPHTPCMDAIKVALRVARFFNMNIVDEIHFMRKVVIDGSNTTGFQRTALIALNGFFTLDNKRYGIQSICVEEEAARIVEKKGNYVTYLLDRLGIPLIEISTSPDIESPEEAVKVAEYIGRVLQATGYRRRGLGTIRQDINISIMDGTVVEVKGVQKLETLAEVIKYEFERQVNLLKIAEVLKNRGVDADSIDREKHVDITSILKASSSKIIRRVIDKGGRVYGLKLPGFKDLLGFKVARDKTLGKEFAERIRFWTGVGGLFHSDELPGYGISKDEVDRISKELDLGDHDAFIIIGLDPGLAELAFNKIKERAKEALNGVPYETRGALEDGSTYYMRPRPGMARMYPETDIPPIYVSPEIIKEIESNPIQDPESIIRGIADKTGLNLDKAYQIFDEGLVDIFNKLYNKFRKRFSSGFLASVLLDYPKALEGEGIDTSSLTYELIEEILNGVMNGLYEKESIYDIMKIVLSEGISVEKAVDKLKLKKIELEEVRKYVYEIISSREDIMKMPPDIRRKRIIGIVMSKYRGRVNPKDVINIVEEALKNGL